MQNQTNPVASSTGAFYSTGLHWVIFRYALVMAFVAIVIFGYLTEFKVPGVVVVAIAIGMWLDALARYMSVSFEINEAVLTVKLGFLSRIERSLFLKDIRSVTVEQSFFGRLLGYGQVIIAYGPEEDNDIITLSTVASPKEFKEKCGK